MVSFKAWVSAARPRTLFLAMGTAICGSGLAYYRDQFSPFIFALTLLVASLLQILSNFANDLGDYQHGTDITGERVGPQRAVQSGAITYGQMKKAIFVMICLSSVVGLTLTYIALRFVNVWYFMFFIIVGLLAIIAAIKYTAGRNPYGYKGFGDVFSFIFFGPIPVVGTYYLHTHTFDFTPWLPSVALGFLSTAVLNTNNMRDLENDRNSGKITIPVRIGINNAKRYHAILILGAISSFVVFSVIYSDRWLQYLYMIIFLLLIKILINVLSIKDNVALDPYLKYTAMSTFFLSVVFVTSLNL